MELWIGIAVAALGSTGVAGLLASGLQFSRKVRLQKSVRSSLELAESFAADSAPRDALSLAADRDAVRLASLSLVFLPTTTRSLWVLLFTTIGLGAVFLSPMLLPTGAGETLSKAPVLVVIAFTLGYVVVLAALLDYIVQFRRDRVVRSILVDQQVGLRWDGSPDASHRWAWHSQKTAHTDLLKSTKTKIKSDKERRKSDPGPVTAATPLEA